MHEIVLAAANATSTAARWEALDTWLLDKLSMETAGALVFDREIGWLEQSPNGHWHFSVASRVSGLIAAILDRLPSEVLDEKWTLGARTVRKGVNTVRHWAHKARSTTRQIALVGRAEAIFAAPLLARMAAASSHSRHFRPTSMTPCHSQKLGVRRIGATQRATPGGV